MIKMAAKKDSFEFSIICNEDFEELVADELKKICKKKSELSDGVISFKGKLEDALRYIYLAQSSKKVLLKLFEFKYTSETKLLKNIEALENKDFSVINGSFSVRSNLYHLEKSVGSIIYNKLENPVVEMSNPDYPVYLQVSKSSAILGIELSEGDLSKRTYKIFSHPSSIKGTLAYFLVAISGYNGKGLFLDPCCGSGTICAEAAYLASGMSLRYFDKSKIISSKVFDEIDTSKIFKKHDDEIKSRKENLSKKTEIRAYDIDLQSVNAAKKNLKIGGIEKFVSVAKGDIDWLETKFKENSVDYIVSNPSAYTKTNTKKSDKFFDIFFYQTEFILSKKGEIVLLLNSERPLEFAKKYKLIPKLEKKINLGDAEKYIYSFTKK